MNWFAWALLSALFAALTAVLAKVGVSGVNPNLATALRTVVILLITVAIAAVTCRRNDWQALTPRACGFLIASGVATGLSWLCYFRALQLGEVSKVAPVDKLSVALALILAAVFLGERLRPQEAAGAALVIIGVVVMVIRL